MTGRRMMGQMLAEATNRLNLVLQEAEKALVLANVGVSADVVLDATSSLRFGKRSGEWQLLVGYATGGEVRLLTASRETRVAAAMHLQELYNALVEQARVECAAVELATQVVEQFNLARHGEASSAKSAE